jgi:phosphoribosylformylglycinamidine synthase II
MSAAPHEAAELAASHASNHESERRCWRDTPLTDTRTAPVRDEEKEVDEALALAHGLTAEEYARALAIAGRPLSYTELGIFVVMWSEHCSYKSSRVHLRKLPTEGDSVLQGPGENAGVVDIGDGLAVTFKMESHNHPSFIEPKQGAATGVGGILRDIFTMGARPIASLDSLRFGPADAARTRYLVGGVVDGIGGYGNSFGCPTVGGEIYFHPSYEGNILVNAFNLGVVRSDKIFRAAAGGIGNPVLYVGSRTGRDGIHGASMASAEFGEGTDAKRPTVQVGDPFTEKLLLEACQELMRTDAIVGIQDMGAAGLTCSTFEMASRAGTGIRLDLDRVPRRETGMTPYELMLSESQERMLMVVERGREDEVKQLFAKWDLEAAVVGEVTEGGRVVVTFEGRTVVDLPARPLAEEAPVYDRPRAESSRPPEAGALDPGRVPVPDEPGAVLGRLLAAPNLCSRAWVYRQYDQTVRTNTVQGPGHADAAVVRLKGLAQGIAITTDCNSRYCWLDPYRGAQIAVAEAARNLSCTGARPIGVTDCLNFGSPERPEVMAQFADAVEGIADACGVLQVPVVSGNVSFYNETNGKAIHPTPTIGMVGLIEDVDSHAPSAFQAAGDAIVLLGVTLGELGGSEYLATIHGIEAGEPPELDWEREVAVQAAARRAIQEGLVHSAHDCSEGGLAVALAECCISGDEPLGAEVDLNACGCPEGCEEPIRADALLFGESQSRIVLSVPADEVQGVLAIAEEEGAPAAVIGRVRGDRLAIGIEGDDAIDLPVSELHAAWSGAFEALMSIARR